MSPSLLPSLQPTSNPSKTPSVAPSSAPSISSKPSSTPSLSLQPTEETISGTKKVRGEDGQDGIQSGCPIPQNVDRASYAEESVIRHVVSFIYTVTVIDGSSWDNLIGTVEARVNQKLFDDYVNCSTARRLNYKNERYMIDIGQANATENMTRDPHPIGVSSLPNDKRSDEMACDATKAGETCVVIDGAVSFLFETDASFSPFLQQVDALSFVKNNLAATIENVNGISGMKYMGAMDDVLLNNDGVIITGVNLMEEIEDKGRITPFGYITVTSAGIIFFVAVALLAMKIIRSNAYDPMDEEILLDYGTEYSKEIVDVGAIPQGGERLKSYAPSNAQNIVRTPLDDNFRSPDDSSPLDDFKLPNNYGKPNNFRTRYYTQEVHRCVSATCEICRQDTTQEGIRFVNVDTEEDGVEVDMMGNVLHSRYSHAGILRSPSSLCKSPRSYNTPDTVEF